MSDSYLSPAFSPRSSEDLAFLKQIDGATAFSLFWVDIVRPLLETTDAGHLLQIGAYKGDHTRHLLQHCKAVKGSLIVIEPFVVPELEQVLAGSECGLLLAAKSHVAIPQIHTRIDAVLLNGDLNYHAVYGDLLAIADMAKRTGGAFPTVVLKSMSWPYARRDMYYDPESVPAQDRHDYERMGMTPWSSGLEERAINAPFCNARQEGGPRNGVLTAVEDFIRDSSDVLCLFKLPINHGLGIIYRPNTTTADFIERMVAPPPALRLLLETWEIARLNDIIVRLRPVIGVEGKSISLLRRIYRLIRRMRGN